MAVVEKLTHYFEWLDDDMKPLDDGSLKFEVTEHGEGGFPICIKVSDSHGRWCNYVPITSQGREVRSYGYFMSRVDLDKSLARDEEELLMNHGVQG